jgi:hypothetical protein
MIEPDSRAAGMGNTGGDVTFGAGTENELRTVVGEAVGNGSANTTRRTE